MTRELQPHERGYFFVGLIVAAAVVGPLWFAARRLQARFGPDWSGSPARLAESITFTAILLALSQVLGTFGLLQRVPLISGAIAIGVVALLTLEPSRRSGTRVPNRRRRGLRSHPERRGLATAVGAGIVIGLVMTPWIGRTLSAYRTGVLGLDSLDYHLPFAVRFAQDGRITALHFTTPGLEAVFHPANSELVLADSMVFFRTDVLAPVMNLVWLSFALLAAWCAGLPRVFRSPHLRPSRSFCRAHCSSLSTVDA